MIIGDSKAFFKKSEYAQKDLFTNIAEEWV